MGEVIDRSGKEIGASSSSPARSLMPEFAIGMTVLLIAAPVVLVGGTVWMALKKRLSQPARVGGVSE